MPKRLNLVGQRFGRLTVIEFSHISRFKNVCWKCLCDCGNKKIIHSGDLRSGHTKSCGCLKKENQRKFSKINISHRMFGTRFYSIWAAMKRRCLNKNSRDYKYYGGRGITCKEWLKFENFRDDMYESYLKHKRNNRQTSIDRINSNGNYKLDNCRWATCKEQANNRRNNLIK